MSRLLLFRPQWRKSSHSGSQGTNCVEVAAVHQRRLIALRDSKNPDGPVLAFNSSEWSILLGAIKSGRLGRPTP
jgi:hypothetical protein